MAIAGTPATNLRANGKIPCPRLLGASKHSGNGVDLIAIRNPIDKFKPQMNHLVANDSQPVSSAEESLVRTLVTSTGSQDSRVLRKWQTHRVRATRPEHETPK